MFTIDFIVYNINLLKLLLVLLFKIGAVLTDPEQRVETGEFIGFT